MRNQSEKAGSARWGLLALMLMIVATLAIAGGVVDLGAQRSTSSAPLGTVNIAPPMDDTGRFEPTFLTFVVTVPDTQTVYYVLADGAVTNLYGTKVITSVTDTTLRLTNFPPLFNGDLVRIVGTRTAVTNSVLLTGNRTE